MADPMSLQTVAAFPAHSSGMCDMDVVGNFLVTCGLSQQYVCVCMCLCVCVCYVCNMVTYGLS